MKFPLLLLCSILLAQTVILAYSPTENICLLPSQPRKYPEALALLDFCDDGYELISQNCFAPCPSGYVAFSKTCWKACAEDASLYGLEGICRQPPEEGYPAFQAQWACERVFGSCTSQENGKYIPYCSNPLSYLAWRCQSERRTRDSVPPRRSLGCRKGFDLVNGICYQNCPSGSQSVGKDCVSGQCPARYTQCGKYCVKGTSCQSYQIEAFEAFLGSVETGAERSSAQVDYSKYLCA